MEEKEIDELFEVIRGSRILTLYAVCRMAARLYKELPEMIADLSTGVPKRKHPPCANMTGVVP